MDRKSKAILGPSNQRIEGATHRDLFRGSPKAIGIGRSSVYRILEDARAAQSSASSNDTA